MDQSQINSQEFFDRLKSIMSSQTEVDDAAVFAADIDNDKTYRVMTIDLTTAALATNPLILNFPFRSFYVITATDSSVALNMRLNDQSADDIPVKDQRSLKLPFPCRRAFLNWAAQSGKSATIIFIFRGEFSTNQISALLGGGVSITEGDSVTTVSTATVSTAAVLFAADTTRKKMMICNESGLTIYLGDSAVTDDSGAKMGIPVTAGGSHAWESTSACYAVSQGGASTGAKIGLTKFS